MNNNNTVTTVLTVMTLLYPFKKYFKKTQTNYTPEMVIKKSFIILSHQEFGLTSACQHYTDLLV